MPPAPDWLLIYEATDDELVLVRHRHARGFVRRVRVGERQQKGGPHARPSCLHLHHCHRTTNAIRIFTIPNHHRDARSPC
jgi:hypothetical protein